MKIVVNLLINKPLTKEEERNEYARHIREYINYVDKLYIYNVTNQDLNLFYEKLNRYDNIVYTDCSDLGEVENYQRMLDYSLTTNANYAIILELGYYYEEGVFQTIRRHVLEDKTNKIAIYTPLPLYGCQMHERKAEQTRYISGGCRLVGTFINLDIYKEMDGFKKEYYQAMFDYDYCIRVRLKGYKILLFNNEVLRNINYRIVEKRMMFVTMSTYDKDPLDIYYEYRNRLYLWEEYKKLDPTFVKLDKKIAKGERHEMRWRDPGYRDKLAMFEKAKEDFKKGITGPIKFSKKEMRS
mgnify:CR=1 FL=1